MLVLERQEISSPMLRHLVELRSVKAF